MIHWFKEEVISQGRQRICNIRASLLLAICLCALLGIAACSTAPAESSVDYFKRHSGVDLMAYGVDVGGLFPPADRFNEQAELSHGRIRFALLSAYPPGTRKEFIFPESELQAVRMYEALYVQTGDGKYTSRVRGGATREFQMLVDSPEEKYQRSVSSVIFLTPWRHQINFEFSAENTLLDIKVNPSSGK
jgi:hypothetical protein